MKTPPSARAEPKPILKYFAEYPYDTDCTRSGESAEEAINNCKSEMDYNGYDAYDDIVVYGATIKGVVKTITTVEFG